MKQFRKIIPLYDNLGQILRLLIINSLIVILTLLLPYVNGKIVDNFTDNKIYMYIFISFVVFLLKEMLRFGNERLKQINYQKIENKLIKRLILHWIDTDGEKRGKIGAVSFYENLNNDCASVAKMAIGTVFSLFEVGLKFVFAIFFVLYLNVKLLFILLPVGLIMYLIYYNKIGKKQKELEQKHFDTLDKIDYWITEVYNNYEFIFTNTLTVWAEENILTCFQNNYKCRTIQNTYSSFKERISYLPIWICEGLFYMWGGISVINQKITLGELLALISYSSLILQSIRNFLGSKNELSVQMNAYNRIECLENNTYKENSNPRIEYGINKLIIQSVTFSYENQLIFEDASMELPLYGMVLIQGGNGTGKSTLLNLLSGSLQAKQGNILIDGYYINTDICYQYISKVSQKDIILDDTVENNIIFFDQQESDIEKLMKEIVSIENINLNSKISADSLSGGEKRSIAVARAIYHTKKILLLDEPDTGLDNKRWVNLVNVLKRYSNRMLIIMVTHRELDEKGLFGWDYILSIQGGKIYIDSVKLKYIQLLQKMSSMYRNSDKIKLCKVRTFGVSMLPTIPEGSIVEIEIGQLQFMEGDIIVFYIYDKLIAHRIIQINKDDIVCKGDNAINHEIIAHKNIIGKVIRVI